MKGMIGLQPVSGTGPLWDAFLRSESEHKVQNLLSSEGANLKWIPHLVDAVNAVRQAVLRGYQLLREKDGLVSTPNATTLRRLINLGLGTINSPETGFDGLIGQRVFFDELQDSPPYYELVNLRVNGSWVTVGSFAPVDGMQTLRLAESSSACADGCDESGPCIIWSDGSCSVPDNDQPIQETAVDVVALAIGLTAAFVVIVLAVIILMQQRRLKERNTAHDFNDTLDELAIDYNVHERVIPREIRRSGVTFLEVLGSGNFGNVQKALLDEHRTLGVPSYICAAKTLLPDLATGVELQNLLLEAAVTAQMDHPNVLSLIGVVTRGEPVCLLLQYCEFGALDSYLQKRSGGAVAIPPEQRRQIAIDICNGMGYIHSKGVLHRDLAARNILLKTGMVVCISDFGLARDKEYYSSRGGALPIRWYPPETMVDNVYGQKADVWSFGVCLWEIWTDCLEIPFAHLNTAAVLVKVPAGERLSLPNSAAPEDQDVVDEAMTMDSHKRPDFAAMAALLKQVQLIVKERDRPQARMKRLTSFDSTSSHTMNPLYHGKSHRSAKATSQAWTTRDGSAPLEYEIPGNSSGVDRGPRYSLPDDPPAGPATTVGHLAARARGPGPPVGRSYAYLQMQDPRRGSRNQQAYAVPGSLPMGDAQPESNGDAHTSVASSTARDHLQLGIEASGPRSDDPSIEDTQILEDWV